MCSPVNGYAAIIKHLSAGGEEYVNTGSEMISTVSYNYPMNTDSITYSVCVDEEVTANLGLVVKCADGSSYFFQYNTFVGYGGQATWINKYPDRTAVRWITAQKAAYLSDGEWHTVKAVFRSNLLAIYLDGELVCYHFGDYGDKFKNATCSIQSYQTVMSLKVDGMGQSERGIFDYDFEFNTPEAATDFSAGNGSLSHEDSSLIFMLNGANASFATPNIPSAVGTKYSALVSVHNTVLLRLKNNTAAEKIKVTITTDSGTAFREIDVAPNSGGLGRLRFPPEAPIKKLRRYGRAIPQRRILDIKMMIQKEPIFRAVDSRIVFAFHGSFYPWHLLF